tara:strand:- start:79 stop:861 length:783 start_codon:yes stop_codon:yes gene_type:complete
MTAETLDEDTARTLHNRLDGGYEVQSPLFREGANPELVTAHRGKTFGIRPQIYHDIMAHYAEEAHDKAIEFQTIHFPFQASLESLGRGDSVQRQVGMHLSDMDVLDAQTHLDILNPSWAYPKMREQHTEQVTEVDAYEDAKGDKWEHMAGEPTYGYDPESFDIGPPHEKFERVMPDGTPNPRTETTTTNIQWADEHDPSNAKQWYVHANRGTLEASPWNTGAPTLAEGPPLADANPSDFGPRPPRSSFEAQEDPYPDDSQ